MLPEAESDYCEDLAEIYILNGDQEDVDRYRSIHLMDKGPGYNQDENGGTGEKFQCEETGAHFEFLEMVRRLKRLQRCRGDIDKLVEEQIKRQLELGLQRKQLDSLSPKHGQQTRHQRTESAKRVPQQ